MNSHVAIVLAHEESFHIGAVTVRPETRELEYGGRFTILEPRVMQVLVALWQAKGSVLSKDDLVSRCWNGRIVGDDAINRVVSRLRHHAEVDAGRSFKIETITRVGYRLASGDGRPVAPAGISRRRLVAIASGIGGSAVLGWGAMRWVGGTDDPEAESLAAIRRILLQNTPDQVTNAVAQLEMLVARSPESPETLGMYAASLAKLASQSPGGERSGAKQRSTIAAQRALRLDPKEANARMALIALSPIMGRWTEIDRKLKAVQADSPDNVFLNHYRAGFLSQIGCFRSAIEAADRVLAVEPDAPSAVMLKALAVDNLGQVAKAQELIEQAFRRWPAHYGIWFTRLYLYAYNGQTPDALAMTDRAGGWPIGVPADNQRFTRSQIVALGDRRPDLVRESVRLADEMMRKGTGFAENAMIFAAALGMTDRYFSIVDRYFFDPGFITGQTRFSAEQRVFQSVTQRYTWFLFRRPCRATWRDPRFEPLLRRIGLDGFWRNAGIQPDYRDLV